MSMLEGSVTCFQINKCRTSFLNKQFNSRNNNIKFFTDRILCQGIHILVFLCGLVGIKQSVASYSHSEDDKTMSIYFNVMKKFILCSFFNKGIFDSIFNVGYCTLSYNNPYDIS